MLNLLILPAVCIYIYLHWFYKKVFTYFEKRNIPCIKPTPIFGNITEIISKKRTLFQIHADIYQKFKLHKIAGFFYFHKPYYIICDPEFVRNIVVKDFDHFMDRQLFNTNEVVNDLLTNSLLFMNGEKWKNERKKFTPIFTSGKQKFMFPFVKACGSNLVRYMEQFAPEADVKFIELCRRFTYDVICTCSYGMEANMLENSNSLLWKVIKEMRRNNLLRYVLRSLLQLPRRIAEIIEPFVFQKKFERSYCNRIMEMMQHRVRNKITRNDFLDSLIRLDKDSKLREFQFEYDTKESKKLLSEIENRQDNNYIEMKNKDVFGQAFLFYAAGFGTTAGALCSVIMELSLNPNIQEKVRDEITTILKNNQDELTYEVMNQMKYTDMVIAETLRKHPPGPSLQRVCTNDYHVPGTEFVIKKNDKVTLPVYALHTDNSYYEKPDEFYPEHFTEEAIAGRPRYSYLPFGEGQHMCIASRFAKMVLKVGLIYMLKNFSFGPSPKMKLPVQYEVSLLGPALIVKDGVPLKYKKVI